VRVASRRLFLVDLMCQWCIYKLVYGMKLFLLSHVSLISLSFTIMLYKVVNQPITQDHKITKIKYACMNIK
jgi:hypothetical protein